MKYVLVTMILLFLAACEGPDKGYCQVDYFLSYFDKSTGSCVKDDFKIKQYYETDSLNIVLFKPAGNLNLTFLYKHKLDSCMFIRPDIFSPSVSFAIGNLLGKQDTLTFERDSDKVKYYLNGKFQYEVTDACRKGIVECIIEI